MLLPIFSPGCCCSFLRSLILHDNGQVSFKHWTLIQIGQSVNHLIFVTRWWTSASSLFTNFPPSKCLGLVRYCTLSHHDEAIAASLKTACILDGGNGHHPFLGKVLQDGFFPWCGKRNSQEDMAPPFDVSLLNILLHFGPGCFSKSFPGTWVIWFLDWEALKSSHFPWWPSWEGFLTVFFALWLFQTLC